MATKKTTLTPRQEVALAVAAAFYAGPAGHALMDNEDGEQMAVVVEQALRFADIFMKESA